VYKAIREDNRQLYAVKKVDLHRTSAQSVEKELKTLQQLQGHPNIIRLEEFQYHGDVVLMVRACRGACACVLCWVGSGWVGLGWVGLGTGEWPHGSVVLCVRVESRG